MNFVAKRTALLLLITMTIGCDRVTKHYAASALVGEPGQSFLADTVRLEYAENTGGFLGLGADWPPAVRTGLFTVGTGLLLLLMIASCPSMDVVRPCARGAQPFRGRRRIQSGRPPRTRERHRLPERRAWPAADRNLQRGGRGRAPWRVHPGCCAGSTRRTSEGRALSRPVPPVDILEELQREPDRSTPAIPLSASSPTNGASSPGRARPREDPWRRMGRAAHHGQSATIRPAHRRS